MILFDRRLWGLIEVQRVIGQHILEASAQFERIEVLMREWRERKEFDEDAKVSRKLRTSFSNIFDNVLQASKAMDVNITASFAEKAKTKARSRKDVTFRELSEMCRELSNIFSTEIEGVDLYCLSKGAGAFYRPAGPLFGECVDRRIPNAVDDISEAGKCFGVGRYTASVFHLMRAMEMAVQALSAQLNIPNVEREWGKLLSDIGEKVSEMPKGDTRDAWSAVHSNLYHVKQAWRNSTMHPKRTYTEEEAREVFDAMKAFMRELAELLPLSFEEMLG